MVLKLKFDSSELFNNLKKSSVENNFCSVVIFSRNIVKKRFMDARKAFLYRIFIKIVSVRAKLLFY
jgi:hypothetical protein